MTAFHSTATAHSDRIARSGSGYGYGIDLGRCPILSRGNHGNGIAADIECNGTRCVTANRCNSIHRHGGVCHRRRGDRQRCGGVADAGRVSNDRRGKDRRQGSTRQGQRAQIGIGRWSSGHGVGLGRRPILSRHDCGKGITADGERDCSGGVLPLVVETPFSVTVALGSAMKLAHIFSRPRKKL